MRHIRIWKLGGTFACALMVAAVLTAGATPPADETPSAGQQYCWLNADSGAMQCFSSEAGMNTARQAATADRGVIQPKSGSTPQLQMGSAGAGQEVVGRFYRDAGFTGGYLLISRNGGCSTGTHTADLSAYPGWNDTVSSFIAGSGCRIGIYDNANLTGSFLGNYRSSNYVGSLNDRASSALFTAG